MSYVEIDPIILAWLHRHGLTLYERYQDSEVRSVDIVDAGGRKFQIWVDPPASGKVVVHVWDYRKRRKDWDTPIDELDHRLEEAVATVADWKLNL